MNSLKYLKIVFLFLMLGCQNESTIQVEVENPLNKNVQNQIISVELSKIPEVNVNNLSAFDNKIEIPSQLIDTNSDGKPDNFIFKVDLSPKEKKIILIKENNDKRKFPQQAHAEVSEKRNYKLLNGVYTGGYFESVKNTLTPPGHTDHNYYYKMEGPAWESDKVGYRLYLDWRNSIDIFGKKVSDIVLPKVGHNKDAKGHDLYHTMADWGMDIFKVGNSLGIGTFAAYVDGKVVKVSKTDSTICTIINDGPILASLSIKYFGWDFGKGKTNLNTMLEITSGSRLTNYYLNINSSHKEFCTGLAKHSNTEFLKSEEKGKNSWNYIALWGKQSLAGADDKLGTVIFYNNSQLVKLTEDELSRIVILHPVKNKINYCFAACWDQEVDGIKTKEEFITYLNEELNKLNHPLKISF